MACAVLQPAFAKDGQAILNAKCMTCHTPEAKDTLSRISHQRKTPEGWLMNIARMQVMHGVKIDDEDRRILVKYLADKQGLAPSETDGARYALERRLNTVEQFDEKTTQMCGRCHSVARVALQRRPAKEWERMVHFHLGQWPSLEYQALSRDRDWLNIALQEMAPELAEKYPLDSQAWTDWQQQRPAAETLAGEWSFSGHMPSKGDVRGLMSVTVSGKDEFKVSLKGQYADGKAFDGSGSAILFNGYEWRANLKIDGVAMRQVFAANAGELRGRMFETERDERGLDFVAAQQGTQQLLAVQPEYLKAGSESVLTLVGSGLSGKPDFGPGVEVIEVLEQTPELIRVKVKAASDATAGVRTVSLGALKGANLAVYRQISEVKVVPAFSVARVGDNGGSTPKVEGRFEAEAWGQGTDGNSYRIGFVPATWSVEPFDERAKEDKDVQFAGVMNAADGIFTPGDAGPNPLRKMSTNNAGNLKVVATVEQGEQTLKAEGQMIVTVQRWNNPPIP
ncbi:quinohemoprotein amine dehydrogenase subunit alpha [Pseudomonas stutzeri]|nr:quinohemoprotein amine dehydrogenase subunit alpha [Stutzerimonas stutzeri]